jgi:hemerythrin-like domain-containing protein
MPVKIGSRLESDFRDPIGLLSDCHRRIEYFLRGLITIAEKARGGAISPANRADFETGLRYFREAAPKHTADEEESLFPRLMQSGSQQTEPVLVLLEHLEAEHISATNRHRIVDRLGTQWLSQGYLSPADAELLLANLQKLRSDYENHIAFEDNQVFPLAARLLSMEELKLIGDEMAARRGVQTTPDN